MRNALLIVVLVLAGCSSNPPQPRIERLTQAQLDALMPKPVPAVTLEQVVELSRAGESAEAMIEKIKQSGSGYDLTPEQMIDLHQKGVSVKVLDFIYNARLGVMRDGFADEIYRRDQACQNQIDLLRDQLLWRPYPYWGGPYWGPYPYPYYRGW